MANEVEVCDMSKKLIMGVVMALVLVVCIPQTASAKTKWKLSATSKNLQVGKISKLTVKNVPVAVTECKYRLSIAAIDDFREK